jgi:peptidoglycan/LPS O-acetylase OafA/YrhL
MVEYHEDNPRSTWSTGTHCDALDGVRGLAILAVTLYRLGVQLDPQPHPALAIIHRLAPVGERGVDLFFVLSGFLITGILLRSKERPHYFRDFLTRRALRIFPLYFLCLAVGLWVLPRYSRTDLFAIPPAEQWYLWSYTSNLRMSWLNAWCFGPFDHFWSLAVEEHFYLVWPAIVLMFSSQGLATVCLATIVIVAVGRTLAALSPECHVAVDVLTIFRIDALAMGALLAVILQSAVAERRIRKIAWLIIAVVLPFLMGIAVAGRLFLGLPNSLAPMFFAAAMALVMLSPRRSTLVRSLESPPLRRLGKYSYGMYVLQLPLVYLLPLSLWRGVLPIDALTHSALYVAGMFGLILLMAMASFHLFESYFLKLKQRFH